MLAEKQIGTFQRVDIYKKEYYGKGFGSTADEELSTKATADDFESEAFAG